MNEKRRILLKLSGEIFCSDSKNSTNSKSLNKLLNHISLLHKECHLGIVIGAGNIFRGTKNGKDFDLSQCHADDIGMLATLINGKILSNLLAKQNVEVELLSAIECPKVAKFLTQDAIDCAINKNKCIVFAGGTGNPYFTTDTTAIIRALQIGAKEVWKATKVDGIYETDPDIDKSAKLIKKLTYKETLEKNIKIMDFTAITFAKENNIKIRVFNMFEDNGLIEALKNPTLGSVVEN